MRIAAFLFMISLCLRAQVPTSVTPSAPLNPDATLPAQKVGPNDLLWISVADCPELTRNFRVSSDGSLRLPLLKQRILAAGKFPSDLEGEIADLLIKNQLLVDPVVSIAVAEYRSVPVSVTGSVKRPVTFQAVGKVTLLDAIAKAEGLSADAGPEILISRQRLQRSDLETAATQEESQSTADSDGVRRIPVKGLIDGSDPSLNIRLFGNEEIRVPPAGRVYVVGNVKKSGAFLIQEGKETTVLKLIALSEGLTAYANNQAYVYRVESGKDRRDEIPIQLGRILERKAPDVSLQANDILYIPDSKGRRLTAQTLDRIAGFGSSTASGVLIFH